MTLRADDRLRPPSTPTVSVEHCETVRPLERRGVAALVERPDLAAGGNDAGLTDASRRLADRLIVGLVERPFRPTADELAWVWGGDLVRGEARASRARIAAGRYAGLLTNHVVTDFTVQGAPGAYARIWLCARSAFITTASSPPPDGGLAAWEGEGGAGA
jgi:hypothetical protein